MKTLTLILVTTASCLAFTAAASARAVLEGDWAAGHNIDCVYDALHGGSVECVGYLNRGGHATDFLLQGNQTVAIEQVGDQPPEATQRPPDHWFHITAGLACRRGPGSILVQCGDRHGSFQLSATTWSGRQLDCVQDPCVFNTIGPHRTYHVCGTGGAPIGGGCS